MSNPAIGRPSDPELAKLYTALGKFLSINPEQAPLLRAHSIGTIDELRRTRGDIAGNLGPVVTILAGYVTQGDNGCGIFYWDPFSTAMDNAISPSGPSDVGTVISVAGVDPGRWRFLQTYKAPAPTPAPQIYASSRTITLSMILAAGMSGFVSETLEIAAGIPLEIGLGAALEIG